MNAKVGRGLDGEEGIIGLHGLDCDRNDNGERFSSFCAINNFAVVTTMFKHKNKTNHPISSNSQPSATANKAIHSLKKMGGGGTKPTETLYNFDRA